MVRFGRCRLDVAARQLFRDGAEVPLSPKAFDLLALLVAKRPAAIPKRELFERIWPDTFVSEASLARLVTELRQAVGDQARSGTIRTVHGFGYAFGATVEDTHVSAQRPPATLGWLILGTRAIPLAEGENVIGRDAEVAVRLDWPSVSRRHACVRVAEGGMATLEDLGSRNGTYLRGERVATLRALTDGDEIRVASIVITFRSAATPGTAETLAG